MMSIKLPQLIATFVQAKNDQNSDAVIACFAGDAIVHDEGQEICGIAAIKKWIDASIEKYQDTLDPINLVEQGNETVLTAQVSGTFDGSPIPLDFHFTINDGKITMLSTRLTGD
ncbi:nuclear transport factor 2 family protein [Pelosinus sp. sgz500959]|uniref:nuclear transport factor 2 family protein n=1 Tax=Pelosinus sp. sgz500959 TaxID=3242472 RepID=UPI00366DF2DE